MIETTDPRRRARARACVLATVVSVAVLCQLAPAAAQQPGARAETATSSSDAAPPRVPGGSASSMPAGPSAEPPDRPAMRSGGSGHGSRSERSGSRRPALEYSAARKVRDKRTPRWRRACRAKGNQVCWTPRRRDAVIGAMHRWMRRNLERRRGASAGRLADSYVYCRSLPDCSCSTVALEHRWFGLHWSLTFDTRYTEQIPRLSAGELLALPGLGAAFLDRLTAVTRNRLAVLALLSASWGRIQRAASEAASRGEQLRLSAYTVWATPFVPILRLQTV